MDIKINLEHVFVRGDFHNALPPPDTSLMIADPLYGNHEQINTLVKIHLGHAPYFKEDGSKDWHMNVRTPIPACIFMMPEDLSRLEFPPDQICHWVKPVSTKNTTKRYSKFVEVIAMFGVKFHEELHWSNRTGVFTDTLLRNDDHPWKKPESLIEKLIRNHYPGSGVVYDPCAGSRTVETVCKRLYIPSFSVEINP